MSVASNMQTKQRDDNKQDMFPLNIKIKQEKTTSYEDSSKSETVDKLSIDVNLRNIFSTTITSNNGGTEKGTEIADVKPSVEPLKSSNEILTELFRVFNAAPPEIIEDDSDEAPTLEKKKKKHKHKKRSKKKKANGSESDGELGELILSDEDEKRIKKKKSKKEKHGERKHEKHKCKKNRTGETLLVTVKQEPLDENEKSAKHNDQSKQEIVKEVSKPLVVKPEEVKAPLKGKIQIKSLKDSAIFKELATSSSQSKLRQHRSNPSHKSERSELRKRKASDSDFSISEDEENAKGRYYDFYKKKYNSFYAGFEEKDEQDKEKRNRHRRSEDRDRRHRSGSTPKSRSRSRSPEQIDKQKLLEIARKNAIIMLKKGTLPGAQNLDGESKIKLISKMRASGKSIEELTAFCKKISHKENFNDLSSVSSDESDHDADGASKAFHHPFQLKETAPIVMNIRNATTIQPKSAEEKKLLLMQFPVSSGAHHRGTETEWIPVDPKKTTPAPKPTQTGAGDLAGGSSGHVFKAKPKPVLPPSSTFVPQQTATPAKHPQAASNVVVPPEAMQPTGSGSLMQSNGSGPLMQPTGSSSMMQPTGSGMQPHVSHMPGPSIGPSQYQQNDIRQPYHALHVPPANVQQQQPHSIPPLIPPFSGMPTPDPSRVLPVDTSIPPPNMNPIGLGTRQEPHQQRPHCSSGQTHPGPGSDNIFNSQMDAPMLDVSQIVTQRLNAMRKLQENPSDPDARKMLYNTQKDMSTWASSKAMPGQFLGSTGVNCLSQRELAEGYQPWATRDMMKQSAPVTGGMGMHLLQKMGWQPGEGLGKEKNGSLHPLLLDVKLDKRGLGEGENKQRPHHFQQNQFQHRDGRQRYMNMKLHTDGKHPVSILGEYATKHKWNIPQYELVHESGPGHAKNFVFKVIVNGLEYQPAIANNTKKEAKATAAKFCLQRLGVMIT